MKYFTIIREGLKYSMENGLGTDKVELFLTGYFKREAQKAKDEYYDYGEFFEGLKTVIEKIKSSLCDQTFVYKKVDEIREKMINDPQYIKLHFLEKLENDEDEYEYIYRYNMDCVMNVANRVLMVVNLGYMSECCYENGNVIDCPTEYEIKYYEQRDETPMSMEALSDLDFMQSLYRDRDDGFVLSNDEYEPDYNWVKDVIEDPYKKIGSIMNNIELERWRVELLENAIKATKNELLGTQNEIENTGTPANDNHLRGKFTEQQATDLHTALCEKKLIKPDEESLLYWFGVTDRPDNLKHLIWNETNLLLGYFVDRANDKFNLKRGIKRRIKPFETMFDMKEGTITSAINEYQKMGLTHPEIGYKIIDEVFKNLN